MKRYDWAHHKVGQKSRKEELQPGKAIREFTLLSICLTDHSLGFISSVLRFPALAFPAFWSVFCDTLWVVLSKFESTVLTLGETVIYTRIYDGKR